MNKQSHSTELYSEIKFGKCATHDPARFDVTQTTKEEGETIENNIYTINYLIQICTKLGERCALIIIDEKTNNFILHRKDSPLDAT